ncbi:DUF4265 domain-containing protein [Teredinibacter waterburyi]|jgi:hypothetical protein|uniref:DUF4265 domain-containing protein n=1 Tax=Teredinibacter waterburyi TaxID=1500538 RepID=UPI00165FAEC7|nr:DUF4265 domain-containing protein [Teredinibacter waterburyi]
MTDTPSSSQIDLIAGQHPDGSPVMEKLQVLTLEDGNLQLQRSPAFLRGVARGDLIVVDSSKQTHTLVRRSGNLCIRVIARSNISDIATELTPALEKMGATLDFENARMLVFSIHVSCGFSAIEDVLNRYSGQDGLSTWFYGNVYDQDMQPLNWWQDILKGEN